MALVFPRLVTAATWDREYASGAWDRLHSDDERARYMLIAGQVLARGEACRVLDVGCGTGRLLEVLNQMRFDDYVGLDLSNEAIERARARGHARGNFVVSDAASFDSDQRFDVIVFNEVAYYLENPEAVLMRYTQLLREGGVIVVSMFECFSARLAWWRIGRRFRTLDSSYVRNRVGNAWQIRSLTPHAAT